MTESNGLDMKNPTDSGCFVLSSTIEPMDLSIAEAAKALGITHVAFSRFNERAASLPRWPSAWTRRSGPTGNANADLEQLRYRLGPAAAG
jgi:hypothetical protein